MQLTLPVNVWTPAAFLDTILSSVRYDCPANQGKSIGRFEAHARRHSEHTATTSDQGEDTDDESINTTETNPSYNPIDELNRLNRMAGQRESAYDEALNSFQSDLASLYDKLEEKYRILEETAEELYDNDEVHPAPALRAFLDELEDLL